MAPVHDRMPVILPPSAWGDWLRPGNDDLVSLGELLVPAPASLLTLRPVSTDVNNVRDKDAHLIDEVDPDAAADASRNYPELEPPRHARGGCPVRRERASARPPRCGRRRASSARIASAAASSSAGVALPALAKLNWPIDDVGITWTWRCGTS